MLKTSSSRKTTAKTLPRITPKMTSKKSKVPVPKIKYKGKTYDQM